MFETYDSIVLICTAKKAHGDEELAELRPHRPRPRLDIEAMIAMHEAAGEVLPPGVKLRAEVARRAATESSYGFAAAESLTRKNWRGTFNARKRPVEIVQHKDGRVFVHLPHHPGCDRAPRLPAVELFRLADGVAELQNTRSVRLDISCLPALPW